MKINFKVNLCDFDGKTEIKENDKTICIEELLLAALKMFPCEIIAQVEMGLKIGEKIHKGEQEYTIEEVAFLRDIIVKSAYPLLTKGQILKVLN